MLRVYLRINGNAPSISVACLLSSLPCAADAKRNHNTFAPAPCSAGASMESRRGEFYCGGDEEQDASFSRSRCPPPPLTWMCPADGADRSLATPAVRAIARANNIDIATVQGSGKGGRVMKEDMLRVLGGKVCEHPKRAQCASAPVFTRGVHVHERLVYEASNTQPTSAVRQCVARSTRWVL